MKLTRESKIVHIYNFYIAKYTAIKPMKFIKLASSTADCAYIIKGEAITWYNCAANIK